MSRAALLLLVCCQQLAGSSSNSTVNIIPISHEVYDTVIIPCDNYTATKSLIWITPNNQAFVRNVSSSQDHSSLNASDDTYDVCIPGRSNSYFLPHVGRLNLLENGSLEIRTFGWVDRGIYACYLREAGGQEEGTTKVQLQLENDYRWWIYHYSLLCGFATAVGFLLISMLCKLIYYVLETYGCCLCCCCCENRLPPRAKKVKVALDSIEAYKQQQLDKLKENYAMQSEWIRQNCTVQMERVRDNYHGQVQNIKDIRQYGSTQIHAVRDQYDEQMQRIRDYSVCQLDRAQDNYISQRQRLRKFSAQNYLRMRATGKYTQRTLNKVLENLPPLYLDLSACRQGGVKIDESMHFQPADFHIEELEPFDPGEFDPALQFERHNNSNMRRHHSEENSSVYFTPSGTPLREVVIDDNFYKSASLKNTPTRDCVSPAEPYKAVYSKHKKSKSLSHFLPPKLGSLFGGAAATSQQQNDAKGVCAPMQNGGIGYAKRSEQTVHAIVERATTSQDYLDVAEEPDCDDGNSTPMKSLLGNRTTSMGNCLKTIPDDDPEMVVVVIKECNHVGEEDVEKCSEKTSLLCETKAFNGLGNDNDVDHASTTRREQIV